MLLWKRVLFFKLALAWDFSSQLKLIVSHVLLFSLNKILVLSDIVYIEAISAIIYSHYIVEAQFLFFHSKTHKHSVFREI